MALLAGLALLVGCASAPGPILVGAQPDNTTPDPATEAAAADAADDGAADPGTADRTDPSPPPFTVVAQAVAGSVTARTEPDSSAPVVAELAHPTANGGPLVFRAVDGATDPSGQWIQVQLPIQPNGTTGWIPVADVTLSNNPFRIEIDRATFTLRVLRQNSLWMETPIAVGTGDTPTPVGEFYLMELLSPPDPSGPYGPYAFGLSGFSEVLDSFGGSDQAIIGLHGTNDPASLGTNVSHGCIRIANPVIEELATTVPLGTPVVIT